jgi:hypothetical protein
MPDQPRLCVSRSIEIGVGLEKRDRNLDGVAGPETHALQQPGHICWHRRRGCGSVSAEKFPIETGIAFANPRAKRFIKSLFRDPRVASSRPEFFNQWFMRHGPKLRGPGDIRGVKKHEHCQRGGERLAMDHGHLVELMRFELTTSAVRLQRSPI